MPQSTIASTRADIEYALSPRTDVGIHASTIRTFSRLSAFYLSDVNVSAERRLSLQWFGNITGGVSMMKPVRAPDPSRDRQTYGYNAGATLGRRVADLHRFCHVRLRSRGFVRLWRALFGLDHIERKLASSQPELGRVRDRVRVSHQDAGRAGSIGLAGRRSRGAQPRADMLR